MDDIKLETDALSSDVDFSYSNSYCRCCFVGFTESCYRFEINDEFRSNLQELLQSDLIFSEGSTLTCQGCCNKVNDFVRFKIEIIEKQEKFNTLVADGQQKEVESIQKISAHVNDILMKHEVMLLKAEPLDEIIIDDHFQTPQFTIAEIFPKRIRRYIKERKPKIRQSEQTVARESPKTKLCRKCDKRFVDLIAHRVKHHGLKHLFECSHCSFTTYQKKELTSHNHNNHSSKLEEIYRKKLCPYCARNVRCLDDHISNVHHLIRNFFCDMCDFASYKKGPIEEHIISNHLPKNIKCSQCNFVTAHIRRLKLHIVNQHENKIEKIIPCNFCSKKFKHRYALEYHINRRHKCELNFPCDFPGCKWTFHTRVEKRNHSKNVHEPKTIICDICGNYYSTYSMLKKHKSIHEEFKYPCQECNVKCRTRNLLNVHIKRKHTFQKDHKCETCGESFFRAQELSHHIALTHLGIRYGCTVAGCTSSLSRKDAYLTHLKSHTNLTPEEKKEVLAKLKEFVEKHNLKR